LWGIEPEELAGKIPPYLPDVPVVREDVADYLGEVAAFDAGLGVLIDELKRIGIYENTILVVSGDHGIPGVSRGKCNLYDLGTQVPLAIRWPEGIKKGSRVINDFVSLPDLAPTFLEAAGVQKPVTMIARSLVPIFVSDRSGQVDPARDAVFTGRERHVARARTDNKPYPQRAIRTDQYLYIMNFEPDRWPMGTGPGYGGKDADMPPFEALREDTFAAFGDMDASPTKAWIVSHRDEHPEYFDFAVGRRPSEELYDIRKDPHCMNNLASHDEIGGTKQLLRERLLAELRQTGDPRMQDPVAFEQPPFTDPEPPAARKTRPNAQSAKRSR
jgi:uncharacterized sulfatase